MMRLSSFCFGCMLATQPLTISGTLTVDLRQVMCQSGCCSLPIKAPLDTRGPSKHCRMPWAEDVSGVERASVAAAMVTDMQETLANAIGSLCSIDPPCPHTCDANLYD